MTKSWWILKNCQNSRLSTNNDTKSSFLNPKTKPIEPDNCLNMLLLSSILLLQPYDRSAWLLFFKAHIQAYLASFPWTLSDSSICPGTQRKVRHINLSQQAVDSTAPVKDARRVIQRGSCQFLCLPSDLDLLTKKGHLTGTLANISAIRQSFWGDLLKC